MLKKRRKDIICSTQSKKAVQALIQDKINIHERKTTKEITENPNKGKKLWKGINKLRKQDNTRQLLYIEQKTPLDTIDGEAKLTVFLVTVYLKHDTSVEHVWNDQDKLADTAAMNT